MNITLNGQDYSVDNNAEIITALWNVSHLIDVYPIDNDSTNDLVVRGKFINYYLLVAVIAMRLAAGDLDLVEKSDSLGKKNYQNKLVSEINKYMT